MGDTNRRGFWDWIVGSPSYRSDTEAAPVPATFPVSGPLPGVMPPARGNAALLDEHTAMSIPGVSRAVSLISGSISQLPLNAYKQGVEVESGIVSNPSETYSRDEFVGVTAHDLAVWGNAYWLKTPYLTQPGVASLEVLNPELVWIEWRNNRKVIHYGGKEYSAFQIQHLMVNPRHAPASPMLLGVGPIQDNREALQGMLDLTSYAAKWFSESGAPSAIMKVDADLGDRLEARLREKQITGGTLVLGNGYDYKVIDIDPESAQFTAIAQKAVTDVARMFGIPANLELAETQGSAMTYSNVQDNDRTFVKHTLMPYIRTIENGFTAVSPNGQTVKFNVDAFLRPDTKTRMETYQLGKDVGAYTTNEIRALEDRPALQEGDTTDNE
jgi:HK97 family phage portal protein